MTINKLFKSLSVVLVLFLFGSGSMDAMDNNNNNNNNSETIDNNNKQNKAKAIEKIKELIEKIKNEKKITSIGKQTTSLIKNSKQKIKLIPTLSSSGTQEQGLSLHKELEKSLSMKPTEINNKLKEVMKTILTTKEGKKYLGYFDDLERILELSLSNFTHSNESSNTSIVVKKSSLPEYRLIKHTEKNKFMPERGVKKIVGSPTYDAKPPFYRLSGQGKTIYILGAIHPLPMEKALYPVAQQEIEHIITKKKPLFITEHPNLNQGFLEFLSNKVNALSCLKNKKEKQWTELMPNEFMKEFSKIQKNFIKIGMGKESQILLSELGAFNIGIVSSLFQGHVSSILAEKFSSFENSIIEKWGDKLEIECYLEDVEYLINKINTLHWLFYDSSENQLQHEMLDKIKNEIIYCGRFLLIASKDSLMNMKFLNKEYFNAYMKNYTQTIPQEGILHNLAIIRNFKWLENFKKLYEKSDNFLIVVGKDHLDGHNSFLKLLLNAKKLEIESIEKFDNENGWIILDNF